MRDCTQTKCNRPSHLYRTGRLRSLRLLRPLLLAALLSCGQTAFANAGQEQVQQQSADARAAAELTAGTMPSADNALPAHAINLPAPVMLEIDLRGAAGTMRPVSGAGAGGALWPSPARRQTAICHISATQRLIRGGIDADHVGTPPPQS